MSYHGAPIFYYNSADNMFWYNLQKVKLREKTQVV